MSAVVAREGAVCRETGAVGGEEKGTPWRERKKNVQHQCRGQARRLCGASAKSRRRVRGLGEQKKQKQRRREEERVRSEMGQKTGADDALGKGKGTDEVPGGRSAARCKDGSWESGRKLDGLTEVASTKWRKDRSALKKMASMHPVAEERSIEGGKGRRGRGEGGKKTAMSDALCAEGGREREREGVEAECRD